ncbi:MAG: hypothetical protein CL881_07890 [Dehalococcoidia bacterium]|nr:hypothetical protein [Dehalococcoidia bacterium]
MQMVEEKQKVCCDYCKSEDLKMAYKAPTTSRNLEVFVCRSCGFIQSWPRLSGIYDRVTSVSGEADWGYIRYGKQLRLDASMEIIESNINLNNIKSVLDIGANRGFFLNNLSKKYPHLDLTGVEPDKIITKESPFNSNIDLFVGKIEDYESNNKKFDFIHSSHTFEHMTSADKGFKITYDLLSDSGYFYLELPRTEMIDREDFITEFFIDNHLFHFTRDSIKKYANNYNFDLIYEEKHDWENHVFIFKKSKDPLNFNPEEIQNNYEKNYELLTSYSKNRKQNLADLNHAGSEINKMINSNESIAIWGMGRIFDIFYHYADVNWDGINYCVDKYLPDYTSEVNGIKIRRPEEVLNNISIDTLIIFSDAYIEDIENEAKKILSSVDKIVSYNNLMKRK